MTRQLTARLLIDLAMTALILAALAYRITGDTAHEWVGVSVAALFTAHNVLHWRWYKNLFKGAYTMRRVINTVVNALLLITMTALIASGLMMSRTVLAFLHLPGGMALRQIHTTAAYWGLVIIAVHIGMHGDMMISGMRNIAGIHSSSIVRVVILRGIALLITAFGVWASVDRDMFAKLFLGFSFDYWPSERPAILFFVMNAAIMCIYLFGIYYFLKLLAYKKRRIQRNDRNT
jgi:hypothetical protein